MEENNNETNEIKQEQINIDNEDNHRKRPFKKWKRKDENKDFQKKDKKEYFKNTEMQDGVSSVSEGLNEKSNLGLHKDLKKVVELNNKNHKNTLNPHYKLDLKTKAKIRSLRDGFMVLGTYFFMSISGTKTSLRTGTFCLTTAGAATRVPTIFLIRSIKPQVRLTSLF